MPCLALQFVTTDALHYRSSPGLAIKLTLRQKHGAGALAKAWVDYFVHDQLRHHISLGIHIEKHCRLQP